MKSELLVRCSCGRRFEEVDFLALPAPNDQPGPVSSTLWRNCACGSTIVWSLRTRVLKLTALGCPTHLSEVVRGVMVEDPQEASKLVVYTADQRWASSTIRRCTERVELWPWCYMTFVTTLNSTYLVLEGIDDL